MSRRKLVFVFTVVASVLITAGILLALDAPLTFEGVAVTGTTDSIEWSWTDNNHSPDNEVGHRVLDTNFTVPTSDDTVESIPDIAPDTETWIETGLDENTQYERYVIATGSSGGGEKAGEEWLSYNGLYYIDSTEWLAQSFTVGAGNGGTLTRLQVGVQKYDTITTTNLTVEFLNDSGGLPGTLIESVTLNNAQTGSPALVDVPLTVTPMLSEGSTYWIALKCNDTRPYGYRWAGYDANVYANGYGAIWSGGTWAALTTYDFTFRTYVDQGSGEDDSPPSNTDARYTLVHDPLDTDFTVTTKADGTVEIDVVLPPNEHADLTSVRIERDEDGDFLGADLYVVQDFPIPAVYEDIIDDTVTRGVTYYYRIIYCNGDGIPTAPSNPIQVTIPEELQPPENFTGIGVDVDKIEWSWNPPSTGPAPDAYQLEDDGAPATIIAITKDTSYIETVSGENTPATRQLRSVALGTTSLSVEPVHTGGYSYPFRTDGHRLQLLYLVSELGSQAGNITNIYWNRLNDGAAESYTDVSVTVGHTTRTPATLDATFANNFTEGDETQVRAPGLYTVPATASNREWVEIPLDDAFYYNGVDNLIIDIQVISGSTNIGWTDKSDAPENRCVRSSLASPDTGSLRTWLFWVKLDMEIVEAVTDPTAPPEVVYSLVHNASTDDFDLTLTADDEVTITVVEPPNASVELTGVMVEYSILSDHSDATPLGPYSQNYTQTHTVTPGTLYYYRITYCNGNGVPSDPSDWSEIDVPPLSDAPTAVIISPTGGIHSGEITITYLLSDPQADTCSIVVEYSLDSGANWASCTMGATGDGTTPLTSTVDGTTHTYSWDTVTDGVGTPAPESVMVKITPSDAEVGTPGTTTFLVSQVGNVPPFVEITSPTGGVETADIDIVFTLTDVDSDTCGATVEYSFDGGGTSWLCTPASGTNPLTGLTSDTTGIEHTFTWNSVADGVGLAMPEDVTILITAWDKDGDSDPPAQTTFTVNNVPQTAPSVTIVDPTGGTHIGNVTVTYVLVDLNSDPCGITVEYTIVGSGTWNSCAMGSGGDGTTPLASSYAGTTHTYVWNTVANGVGLTLAETVKVRITPDDGISTPPAPVESSEFTVDNTGAGPPQADFTADSTFGPASHTVTFTDTSTGDYDSWAWDFDGDGTIDSTEPNPTHIYRLVGTYTVTLTVDGPNGSDTETKVGYITVTDTGTITADFSAAPRSGTAPLDVQFTDLSVGDIASWSWDFGDGSLSATPSPSHQYANTGLYTVSLTVNGPAGSDTETKTGYISVTAGAGDGGGKDKGGCSCTVDRDPTPLSNVLGYFLPALLLACAYLALRRRSEA